jgi:hypothetical protein
VVFSLAFFDDAELEPMPEMLCDVTWTEIKVTIGEWIRQLA